MFSRSLALSAAVLCALWAQGVVLCVGGEGHSKFELQGMACCPADDDECHDCVDTAAPDPLLPPGVTAPDRAPVAGDRHDAPFALPGRAFLLRGAHALPILGVLRSVVLVV